MSLSRSSPVSSKMMDLGSFGYGGSSPSSNLSALAPPFTVDRFIPKSSSKPIVHFPEAAYPLAPFDSSPQSWLYSQNSRPGPHFSADRELEIETSPALHLPKPYRFSGSQSVHLPTTVLPTSIPNPISTTDAFSYTQFSDSSITSLAQTDPYYAQYVTPAVHDNSPLLPLDQPVFDLLPTSSVASLSGSYPEDYTQSLSGLEYPAVWGHSFWNGLGEEEPSKRPGFDESFGQKKANVAASSIYNNYPKQATAANSLEKAPAIFDSISADIMGKQTCFGSVTTDRLHDKGLGQNCSNDSSKMSVLGSTIISTETHSDPSLQSITNYFDHQKPYGALQERSSPAVVWPSSSGTISPPTNVFSSRNLNFAGHVIADPVGFPRSLSSGEDVSPREDFFGSSQKEPDHLVGWKGREACLEDRSQITLEMEKNCPIFLKSFAMGEKEILNNPPTTEDADNQVLDESSEILGCHMNGSYDTKIAVRAEGVDSAEKLYESLDHCAPGVDSPCWKGAPVSRFSSFEVSEDTPLLLMKKLEASNDFTVQRPSVFPLISDDSVKVSSQKFNERTSYHVDEYFHNGSLPPLKRPSVTNPLSKVRMSREAAKDEPGKEYALYQKLHLKPEENRIACEIKVPSGNGLVNAGTSVHNVSEKGSVQFNPTEYPSRSLSSGEDVSVKLVEPHEGKLTHSMNVQTLVGSMHNLSEVLLLHCSNNSYAFKERDLGSLMDVINNLEACIVKVEHLSSRQESLISQQGNGLIRDTGKDLMAGQPILVKEAAASVEVQHVHDEIEPCNMSCEKDENTDIKKDDGMTKAIKKVLQDNFPGGIESHPESLLYKNLWLEAEAALCSLSFRARYDRVKIEMGKDERQKVKDVSENPVAEGKLSSPDVLQNPISREKLLSPKVCHVAKVVGTLASDAKDIQIPDISIRESPVSSTISHVNDVDTSVMARFLILKCRGENLNPTNFSSGQLSPEFDDRGFSGMETHWSPGETSEDECLDMAMEHDLQRNAVNHTEDDHGLGISCSGHETMKKLSTCFPDDGLIQSSGSIRLGKQLQAGWYDSSSSEWEHVPKEEVASQH